MQLKTAVSVAGVVVIAAAAGAYFRYGADTAATTATAPAPLTMPAGITMQIVGGNIVPGRVLSGFFAPGSYALADAKDMTLYTYDLDKEPNVSACADDCIKAWPAATPAANAVAGGDWTIVTRTDGVRQWALRGKPLYTSAKDALPGEEKGNGDAQGVWHTAKLKPGAGITLPNGIGTAEVADAQGIVLVDHRGFTLYAFDGDAEKAHANACAKAAANQPCANHWVPLAAAQIAHPVGDFTLVDRRADGIRQWAYKGAALYTNDNDLQPSEAKGIGSEKGWHAAMIGRNFMPAEARLIETPNMGNILATAQGMTLYRREGHLFHTGGHSIPRSVPGVPVLGRAIGTAGCNADCLKTWHPLVAPAAAQPSGYWDIAMRDDGTRQWAYKGYPLYTYDGDKKPGETTGYDTYDILVEDGIHDVDYKIQPTSSQFSLYWTTVDP